MAWRAGQASSPDPREGLLAAVDGGVRAHEAAPPFRVSIFCICEALELRAANGSTAPSARGGAQRKVVLSGHDAALLAHLRAKSDATPGELRGWLLETRGVGISVGALWKGLDRPGWTLKGSRSGRRNGNARTWPPPGPNGGPPKPG